VVPVERVAFPLRKGEPASKAEKTVVIPEVAGQGLREAVLALHQRGVKVSLRGGLGVVQRTDPAAGSSVAAGATVVLWADE
jgi:beta-lactam-binding protein with PASTA domain